MEIDHENLLEQAKSVLEKNDRKKWTVPAPDLYPHQWLWDSCFVAIGLRHLDIERAQTELKSLIRGQWSNGMLPNMIFSKDKQYRRDRNLWRSWVNPYAPDGVTTSGVTQPPLLAEAVVRIGEKLKMPERRTWYKQMYPALVDYHEWLYRERSPERNGLVTLIHPYESGMDSSPAWISELYQHGMPWWIKMVNLLHLDFLARLVRRDTATVPASHRMDNLQAMAYWAVMLRLRRKAYNSESVLRRPLFAVQDLGFNSVLARANEHLRTITKTIGHELPTFLAENAVKTKVALDHLWDDGSGQYYSRCSLSQDLIVVPTISTLLPLYAGTISKERAERLVELLKSGKNFGSSWPVPSVPLNSPEFDQVRYWQGPTWVNTNWLIIDGLKRYGYNDEADALTARTLAMVQKGGMNEYFDPKNGEPVGAPEFSWTAALTIDLLKN